MKITNFSHDTQRAKWRPVTVEANSNRDLFFKDPDTGKQVRLILDDVDVLDLIRILFGKVPILKLHEAGFDNPLITLSKIQKATALARGRRRRTSGR